MIDFSSLLTTFLTLVQIDSPTGHESEVSAWILNYLDELGISNYQDRHGNVLARTTGSGEPLILTAHMDTVEPGRGIFPQVDSGIVRSNGKTILGADNKAALSAILETLTTITQNNHKYRPVEAIFTISEESGNLGAANVDLDGIISKTGFSFDASGELGTIITASPYYNRFDITLSGRSAHAAHPELAQNVLEVFRDILARLKFGRVDSQTTVNIGKILAGSVRNTIPGTMTISGEIRSFKKTNLDLHTANLKKVFTQAIKKSGHKMQFEVVTENPGFNFSAQDPLIRYAASTLSKMNITPTLKSSHACFDANVFIGRGLKIVNLSDGTLDNHTVSESISVDNLNLLYQICLQLVNIS